MLPLLLVLSCAPAAKVDVSPELWRQKLTAARPGEHDAWLERLKLKPVTNSGWTTPTLERVELRTAKSSGAPKAEVLVIATFKAKLVREREMLSDEVTLLRVQVLQPAGATWCAISDVLSADVIAEDYNAGPADGMKDMTFVPTFSLVNFSHTAQQTLEVHKPIETISRMSSKGEYVEWWDLVDGKLVQLWQSSTMTVKCGPCEHLHNRKWFERRGTPPVTLVEFNLECDDSTEKVCPVREEHVVTPSWQRRD